MHHRHSHEHGSHRHGPHGHGRRFARDAPGEGRERGHHHGHERGGRRERRLFDHGELRLVVLALVAERPRHGYEIIKEIEERAGGTYTPSPGVIYPTLTMLEELGHATVTESGGKKQYAITPDGEAVVAQNRAATDGAMGRLRAAGGTGPAPGIVRGMENLRTALRLRLGRGSLTKDQAEAVAAALDAAALAVERS